MRKGRREEGGKLTGSESQLGAGGWQRNPADSGLSRYISGCGAGSKWGGQRNLDTRDSQRIRRQHPALPASHTHIPPQPTGLAPCALRRPPHAPSSGHLLRLHAAGPPRGSRPGGGERERGSTKSPIPRCDVPPPPPRPLRTPPRWGESAVRTSKSAPRPLVTSRAQAGYPG